MAEGLLITYLIGLVASAIFLAWGLPKLPKEETKDLNMGVAAILVILWPILIILMGFVARRQNR